MKLFSCKLYNFSKFVLKAATQEIFACDPEQTLFVSADLNSPGTVIPGFYWKSLTGERGRHLNNPGFTWQIELSILPLAAPELQPVQLTL